ncbi:hypothetical protein F8388_018067 [Cannabis sativa]|uniref:Uncharacterized protein n=1 Tax=Cannabis sativa TaxID=3483 RepID=A0A7J6HKM3_CANSA|nr:hypothetical protein F8388_018067 [Cannabis sativa]
MTSAPIQQMYPDTPGIWTKEHVEARKPIVDGVHAKVVSFSVRFGMWEEFQMQATVDDLQEAIHKRSWEIILIVGTKLQVIITKMGLSTADEYYVL